MTEAFCEKQVSTGNHRVVFEPMGISCSAPSGKTIREIAAVRNIDIRSDCGGEGNCGKCLVSADPVENLAPVTRRETELLTPRQIRHGFRLACEAAIRGPLKVYVPLSAIDTREGTGKTGLAGEFSLNPLVKRIMLPGSVGGEFQGASPRDLAELVRNRVKETFGIRVSFAGPEALGMLSRSRSGAGDMTLVNHARRGITAVLSGRRERSLGIAVDIGTTTLAAYLCDFRKGGVLASAASANPQRRFGEDVISRIAFADRNDSGLTILQQTAIDEINTLMEKCVQAAGAGLPDIDEMTVVGNTTMEQIFMGFHPRGLGSSPYLPVSAGPNDFKAGDLGLKLNPGANVHVFPAISGFVGGDTVGVILSERPHERDDVTLIVDIGTNGELVLGSRNGLWATSCATGPALEGAHIHCGMRASAGAIDRVSIDPGDFTVSYDVIGGKRSPQGICGSGIIDAVAALRAAGLILPSGRLQEGLPGVVSDENGIGRRFILAAPRDVSTDREIFISLDDIRQVQLAKSAFAVGIKLLMRKAGVDHFDRLVLTGAFGARFNWKNAADIGMLPETAHRAEVKIVENAAGQGAVMALLDSSLRDRIHETAQQVRVLDLAREPDFAEEFAAGTLFPDQKNSS
ncbi:MAG: ASKHA domain-containing protein [Thermodesulfobacteriota bacterium]